MTPAQKQTTQYELRQEKRVLAQLEQAYRLALERVKEKLRKLDERTDEENRQAIAYQKSFQGAVQKQLEQVLEKLHNNAYDTVQAYLQDCYTTGHTAVLYELQSDGLRLTLPIPQDKVHRAVTNETKLSRSLYDSIGEDFDGLKKHITDIISAGFASGASYGDMANQITGKMIGDYAGMRGGALGRAKLIVRTEGNRIANAARLDAAKAAKERGADLVKQWDSTMDKKTRPHHVQLDGQVRELDEPFEVAGRKAQMPGKFGIASEDINCRCHAYSRPRWAVRAASDYKYDNEHRELTKVSGASYAEYRAGYLREETETQGAAVNHSGYAAEVTPPIPKDNGGTGKTYSPEKIEHEEDFKITKKNTSNGFSVNRELVNAKQYHDKFSGLTEHKAANESVYQQAKRILEDRDGKDTERMAIIDARTGELLTDNLSVGEDSRFKTGLSFEEYQKIKESGKRFLILHNHPSSTRPSITDILTFWKEEKADASIVVGHDGTVYVITDMNRKIPLDKLYEKYYNDYIAEGYGTDLSRLKATDTIYSLGAFAYKIKSGKDD